MSPPSCPCMICRPIPLPPATISDSTSSSSAAAAASRSPVAMYGAAVGNVMDLNWAQTPSPKTRPVSRTTGSTERTP